MLSLQTDTSVGGNLYRRIGDDIIFGTLKPGQKLPLEKMREQYSVSVTTLREILNRLAADGFILAGEQKGFRVAPVSREDFEEVAELRLLLESHGMEKSFSAGDIEWEAQVIAAHHRLQDKENRMVRGEDVSMTKWKWYDWSFHQALITGCGSHGLVSLHKVIFGRFTRYQQKRPNEDGCNPMADHLKLLEAAMERDIDKGLAALKAHIEHAVELNIDGLPARKEQF